MWVIGSCVEVGYRVFEGVVSKWECYWDWQSGLQELTVNGVLVVIGRK